MRCLSGIALIFALKYNVFTFLKIYNDNAETEEA